MRLLSIALVSLGLTACAPVGVSAPRGESAGEWHVLSHIKMAAFSVNDPRTYDLMIFCDDAAHVRLFHTVPLDEADSNLVLRSRRASLVLRGERQETRATPPPVSSDPGPLAGYVVMARLEKESALSREFDRSGQLQVRTGAYQSVATDGDEADALRQLWTACA